MRAAAVVAIAVASLTCAGVGYVVGSSRAPVVANSPSPVRGEDAAVAEALRDVTVRLEALERAVASRPAATQREDASPAPVAGAEGDPAAIAELARLVDRLSELITQRSAAGAEPANEVLRQTRTRNPTANLAAVRLTLDQLQAQEDLPKEQKTAQRDLMLRTMPEVMERLGMPSSAFGDSNLPNDVFWEYADGDDRVLTIHYRNGLVIDVDD